MITRKDKIEDDDFALMVTRDKLKELFSKYKSVKYPRVDMYYEVEQTPDKYEGNRVTEIELTISKSLLIADKLRGEEELTEELIVFNVTSYNRNHIRVNIIWEE